jgi:uncharacterized membrane protein YbhN (UPF0104 family)
LKTSFIGNFLNQGLPGSIGGDVYRSFMAVKKGASKTWAFHSLLLDRMFGVFFMGILGVFSLPFVWPKITSHSLSLSLMLVFVPIGIVLVCVVLSVVRIPFFTSFFETYRSFFKSFKAKFWAFGFFITLFLYLPLYLFALDLGYEITFSQILCIFPSVFLLSVLPISLAGWGVRETAFVMFFGAFGVAADKALTLSILYGLITFLFSFTGIIAYFIPISGKFKNLQNPLFNCPR